MANLLEPAAKWWLIERAIGLGLLVLVLAGFVVVVIWSYVSEKLADWRWRRRRNRKSGR